MSEEPRYAAFISYAHKDKLWAAWLHRRLENYRVPKNAAHDKAGRRPLRPVFRDRDELTASSALGPALMAALEGSGHLILLCSPASAKSKWVNEEVRAYKRLHGAARVLPFIVDGEPGTGGDDDCLPPALLEPETEGGPPIEPICADARKHADGRRLAFLKLAAGMLDVGLDELVQRDNARRQRRMAAITGASMLGTVAMGGLALYANDQRGEAVEQRQVAEANARRAEKTVDFLVDTFEVANPETENARTITAFSILERGAGRIGTELADEPQVQVKLYGALGHIYQNLGLYPQADRMISAGRQLAPAGTEDAVRLQYDAALNAYHEGRLDDALALSDAALADVDANWSSAWELRGKLRETRGLVFREQFDLDKSLTEYDAAIRLYEMAGRQADQDRAWAENMKGSVLALKSENAAAERSFQTALELYRREVGADSIRYASTLNNLAFLQLNEGKAEESARNSGLAIQVFQKVVDDDHPTLATVRMMRGNALFEMNDNDGAKKMYAEALSALQKIYPQGHYQIGFAHVYLARSLSREGQSEEALGHLDMAKREYDRSYGEENANHGDLEINRAIIFYEAGRKVDAEAACRLGRTILARTIGLADPGAKGLLAECSSRGLIPED